MIVCEEDNNW